MGHNVRRHVVLVPGFVGFAALGRAPYYAGVTERFGHWLGRGSREGRGDHEAVLHVFYGWPAAPLAVRAARFCLWLATRIARGEIGRRDRVCLVGHSTGGLDIRRVVVDLTADTERTFEVDGVRLSAARLLATIDSLVFLSVPHFGTNFSEFVLQLSPALRAWIAQAAQAVWLNRSALAAARRLLLPSWADSPSHYLLAALDALTETETQDVLGEAQVARAQLAGSLEHIAKDLASVRDLGCALLSEEVDPWSPSGASASPARFSHQHRRCEIETWRDLGLHTRSYATWVPPELVEADPDALRFVDAVYKAAGTPSLHASARVGRAALALRMYGSPQLLFDLCFSACADPRGPFPRPPDPVPLRRLNGRLAPPLRVGDNDGVVNTLSMLWPFDESDPGRHSHVLVEADHADIIGHYALQPSSRPGRRYRTYDLLQSPVEFDHHTFSRVWLDLFDFAARA